MGAACGHQICELIGLLEREKTFSCEPSVDDYAEQLLPHCFIKEHRYGETRPHFDKSTLDDAVRFVDRLKPEIVRLEIERLQMVHAARALAKFVSTQAGNRDALLSRLTKTAEELRSQGTDTRIAESSLNRLYDLGVCSRT